MSKILLLDIDGCITPPNRTDIDLRQMERLQAYITKTDQDDHLPKPTIYTGRSQGYVELLAQMLHFTSLSWEIPFVVENGTALYYPKQKRFETLLDAAAVDKLYQIKSLIKHHFPNNPIEPKENIITLNPCKDETIESLHTRVNALLSEGNYRSDFCATSSSSSVDILPQGYDKLYGIRYLIEHILHEEVFTVAIGDSQTDKEVLLFSDKAYIPSNANSSLKDQISKTHQNFVISQREHIGAIFEMIEIENRYNS